MSIVYASSADLWVLIKSVKVNTGFRRCNHVCRNLISQRLGH